MEAKTALRGSVLRAISQLELLRSVHDLFLEGHTAPMLVATEEQLGDLASD